LYDAVVGIETSCISKIVSLPTLKYQLAAAGDSGELLSVTRKRELILGDFRETKILWDGGKDEGRLCLIHYSRVLRAMQIAGTRSVIS
jgi:hypothetical protein